MLKFNNIKAKLENDSIISLTNNNITYIEPHTLKIKGITYLFFNEYEDVYIHDLGKSTNDFKEITNYSPLYDKIQKLIFLQEKMKNKNKKYVNKFMEVINLYNRMLHNRMLQEACEKYDYVEYCDITFLKDYCAPMDFHPNTIGNKLIADMLLKKIELQIDKNNQSINDSQTFRVK